MGEKGTKRKEEREDMIERIEGGRGGEREVGNKKDTKREKWREREGGRGRDREKGGGVGGKRKRRGREGEGE